MLEVTGTEEWNPGVLAQCKHLLTNHLSRRAPQGCQLRGRASPRPLARGNLESGRGQPCLRAFALTAPSAQLTSCPHSIFRAGSLTTFIGPFSLKEPAPPLDSRLPFLQCFSPSQLPPAAPLYILLFICLSPSPTPTPLVCLHLEDPGGPCLPHGESPPAVWPGALEDECAPSLMASHLV